MPPSQKQIADLAQRTPAVLREPEKHQQDAPGPKGALMLWAAARGFNPPEAVHITIRDPDDDEIYGTAFIGNVAVMALVIQLSVEAELMRTKQIEAARQPKPEPPRRTTISEVQYLAHLRRLNSPDDGSFIGQRLNLSKLTKQALDALDEVRTRAQLTRAQLADYLRWFEARKNELAVPLISSGYMSQPQRSHLVTEKTVLLHHITGMGIPLLRAIAMIGELRNGPVPVDVEHRQLARIYDRHDENLAALRKTLKNARGRFEPRQRNLPMEQSGNNRHKRRKEREAPAKGRKRERAADRG